ncbi:MAG TPA: hypothetical protein VGP26_13950 [Actinophytocola sp.]|jgi:hypothetical protein|nr:hypothetical protein [Actinophytocola sp.]
MIRLGTLLVFFGLGSALLHLTSVQFRLLMWAEPMQPAMGLALGGAGVVVIVLKLLLGKNSEAPAGAPAAPPAGARVGAPQYGQPQQFAQAQFGQAQVGQPYGQPATPPPGQFPPPPARYGPPSGARPVPQLAPQPGPQPVGAPPQQFGPQGFQQPNPFDRPRG